MEGREGYSCSSAVARISTCDDGIVEVKETRMQPRKKESAWIMRNGFWRKETHLALEIYALQLEVFLVIVDYGFGESFFLPRADGGIGDVSKIGTEPYVEAHPWLDRRW